MSLISTTIANLINGVSQQPYALRLASQCELQENCNSSVVDGLCKRNGTKHSARVSSVVLDNSAFTHLINRDTSERYRVIITNGQLLVYDLAGNQKTVNFPNGAGYLSSSYPAQDFKALTVADYTFILNRSVVANFDGANRVPNRPPEALIWFKQGLQDTYYEVSIGGYTGWVTTGDVGNNTAKSASTSSIINGIFSTVTQPDGQGLYVTMPTSVSGQYVFQVAGSTVGVWRVDGGDFPIHVKDGAGDQAIVLIKGKTQRFTNLPATAINGFKVEVQGEGGSFNQSYWVEYVADAASPFNGTWKEGTKPNEQDKLVPGTMPHVLIRNADGTFTFKEADWVPRKVGDVTVSNPMPSFIGRQIGDIFFHRNRLGFVADENVIMSASGDFFNFFKGSAIQALDTDPIDVAVSNTKVSILNHAVSWNESLLLFSDQTQFMLAKSGGNDVLTYKTASIEPTTNYECTNTCKPINVGKFVYFVQERGNYSAVREFAVDAYTQTKDAQDITSHVPKYIPGALYKLTASNTESVMVGLSRNAPNELFVYQYYISGDSKLQSAWHKWVLPSTDKVLNADFIGSDLHMLISRPDGLYLETLTVTSTVLDGAEKFSVHLDRQLSETTVTELAYASNTTTFRIPYTPQPGEEYVLVAWDGNTGFKIGQKVPFTVLPGNLVRVDKPGNLQHFRFGRTINARYVFSQFEIRENAAGGGQTAVGEGRVNVRRTTLTYGLSGYFKVDVTPRGRTTNTTLMSGRQIGNSNSLLGQVALNEGVLRVPVMARNIDVTIELSSDEFLPFSILSADWEGMYVIRSRRI